ncbi:peroxiredoxin [Lyngbya confervoides]|uniref:thioredoxin-dependent peroxiredoxin n=1 Tax=Lyngbya confervoides BDU141951 TaxID=1574623 RepID=A0ABD4SZY5_9CYAN|nr:peroxiredoxin [Lyngbya confervoides]MCM1981976.1 peroxiredoxin [Lyngbya confervoides BDU141951]
MSINVGDSAPDFSLPGKNGKPVHLKAILKEKPVVLYFYPKDDTPGCTKEACSFRDAYQEFQEAGAAVIGVSADSVESHQKFSQNHQLPFELLSDRNNQVRKLYGVPATFGLLPGRVTYVIDQSGTVRHLFNSQLNIKGHIENALTVLKSL